MRKLILLFTILLGLSGVSQKAFATDCPGATVIPGAPTMPYVINLSCGATNDINGSNAVACGSTNYMGGFEALYVWTPSVNYENVTFAYSGQTWTGIFLWQGCPTDLGTSTCIGNFTSTTASKTLAFVGTNQTSGTTISLTAGVTYYIMVDTWPTPDSPCPGTLTINGTAVACAAPTALTATGITTTTANLGWTSSASLWNVEVGLPGFTPGTGAAVVSVTGTTNNPWQATGLSAATSYQFYVQADCGGSGVSTWAGPYSFATSCIAKTIPFFEGFETNHIHNTALGNCWTQEAVSGTNVWTANNTFTDYNRTPRTGSFNAFLSYGNTRWMFQEVELTGGVSYTFDIYARQDGATASDASITVAYGNSPAAASMTNSIIPLTGIINGNYQLLTGVFTPPTTGIYYIGILGTMNFTPWYISIDDINLYEVPTCLAPTALTATGITESAATLEWTSPAPEFQIEWGLEDFTLGTGTFATTANTTYPLSGLSAATVYEFYVRAICGVGDTSSWAGPYAFATSCPTTAYNLPFFEDFEGVVCWSVWNEDGGGVNWQLATNQNHTPFGNVAAVHNYGAVGYDESGWIFTPDIILPAGGTYELLFWSYTEFATYYGNSAVIVSTDDFLTYDTIWSPTSVSGNVWTPVALDLSSYGGNTISVAFRYQGNDGHRWWIDDVLVQEIIGAEINPVAADYDLTFPADVKTTITWNDASSIVTIVDDQTVPYTLIEYTDYEVLDDTLFVYDSYLASLLTVAGNTVDLTITFDAGVDALFVITAIETVLVDAEINPITADYDLTVPGDVSTTITWNDATIITSIIDDQGTPYTLIENTDYTLSGNTLTILDSYLANILLASGDDVVLTITFDQGVALFTINAIQTVLVEVIAHWDFEDAAKRALITSNPTFISNPYTADNGIAANIDIAPIVLVGAPLWTAWVAGSGGTGTWAPNSNTWDGTPNTKYWMITVSTSGYENLKLSSKQMGSNTGPRDFQIEFSTDGMTWVPVGSLVTVLNDNFTSGVVSELDLPATCNNQPILMIRWISTSTISINGGTVAAAGTDRIDDILITGTDVTVSVPEFTSDVKVYPNPSNGQFVIESNDNWVMMVFDITGRMIASDYLNKGSNDINLLNQPAGLYLIKLMNENQTQTLRIVIE